MFFLRSKVGTQAARSYHEITGALSRRKNEPCSELIATLGTMPIFDSCKKNADLAGGISRWWREDPARLSASLSDAVRDSSPDICLQAPISHLRNFFLATGFDIKIDALKKFLECCTPATRPREPDFLALRVVDFLLSYHIEATLAAEHLAGHYCQAQRAQQALSAIQAMGIKLPQCALKLLAWRIGSETAVMYDTLLEAPRCPAEARRTLRWMAAMRGPQQAVYATIRKGSKNANFEQCSLKSSHAIAESTYQSLSESLPTSTSKDILTLNLAKPWDGNDDIYMSFHARTKKGFSHSFHLLCETYEAALVGAWCKDSKRVGELTRHFFLGDTAACAEGKTAAASLFLEQLSDMNACVNEISSLWRQVDLGQATPSSVMSEHVRVFWESSRRAYVKEKYGKSEAILSEEKQQELAGDANFTANYYNTELLLSSLRGEKARICSLQHAEIDRLIAEQVDIFVTIERP